MNADTFFQTKCYPDRTRLVGLLVTCPDGAEALVCGSQWSDLGRLMVRVHPPDKPAPATRMKDGSPTPCWYRLADIIEINGEYARYVLAEDCRVETPAVAQVSRPRRARRPQSSSHRVAPYLDAPSQGQPRLRLAI
jgi:hypothetical protein